MIVRQKIKQYPTEKWLRLKKEAAAKREWRLRKKLSIQTGIYCINVDKNKDIQCKY